MLMTPNPNFSWSDCTDGGYNHSTNIGCICICTDGGFLVSAERVEHGSEAFGLRLVLPSLMFLNIRCHKSLALETRDVTRGFWFMFTTCT